MSLSKNIEIINKLGMHARAAAQFVQLASSFSSHIEIEKDKRRVNGKSIMGVMTLAAECGSELELVANGVDEEFLINEISGLFSAKFNED